MFSKTYKLKSSNTLKNSEKKHLAQRIQDEFPLATEENAKELIPVKANSSCMKLILHSGETVGVYVVDGLPIMIELADGLVPTVYALWKVPDFIPMLTIQSLVLSKVANGAPLYVPGVLSTIEGGVTAPFASGAVVGARTSDNAAAAIVGRAALSSTDLLVRASGVCLEPVHVYRDLLCTDPKFTKMERPQRGAPVADLAANALTVDMSQLRIQKPVKEEWPSLGKPVAAPVPVQNEPQLIPDMPPTENVTTHEEREMEVDDSVMDNSENSDESAPTNMDELLQWCLLSFIKLHGKTVELPLKTNLLYKNYLMPLCPADRTLDVKKTSYKKMGKFLETMQKEGLIEIREIEKGVDAAVAVNVAHPLVRAHSVPASGAGPGAAEPAGGERGQYVPPQVREMYCVTAAVADLLAPHRKGTALTAGEVRAAVTDRVRAHGLAAPRARGAVVLDPLLARAAGKPEQEIMKWEELMSCVYNKMTAATETRSADGTVRLSKAKLEPIKMQVATRSGNKKVTLVSNLEAFGFSLVELAPLCQVGVAASCGVTRAPGAKCDQLMLQGDQTHFMAKLLVEKYGLPKKYIEGADKALKKKK